MSDATNLRRTDVDTGRRVARLRDTKSGESWRPLSQAVLDLIGDQPKTTNPYVFPARISDHGAVSFRHISADEVYAAVTQRQKESRVAA